MPSWWGKSSSKETKKKTNDETFLDSLRRKLRSPTDVKSSSGSGASRRRDNDIVLERVSKSRVVSRSSSPSKESKHVDRCQSFAERPLAQPLPLPSLHPSDIGQTDSGISITLKPSVEKNSKSSLFLPLPRPSCIRNRGDLAELDGDLVTASVSSVSSLESDLTDSRLRSPQASDIDIGPRTAAGSPSSSVLKDQSILSSRVTCTDSREPQRPVYNLLSNQNSNPPPRRRRLGNHVPHLQVPSHGAFCGTPDSSISSPSRSPMRAPNSEQIINAAFWASKPYPDVTLLGSGHCSSPGSGHNSGHNSMGGDIAGQLFWQPSRGSPEYSPIPSPRVASPGPGSRVQSGAVTPIHPRAGGSGVDMHSSWGDDGKQQSHRLPLPPITIPSSSPFSHGNSAATSPSVPRSPTKGENPPSPGSRWKKGRLLGRGTFGHVYLGFNRETGEMCAMKEVTLFSDDPKSKESSKQLGQEIALLSRLRHPNIVQYYGSETVGDRLYIYLEFVSGGSIYKLLQEYGQLGEQAIRSFTQQILSGLAYLHGKNTVHRDIKGANILVDPNGRVKLADFGMAKHITGQSCPLSFKGSPYWMAPEVIKNSGCNLAVDIWSLGCTVLEMATTKPPWSQYEGVAAMFKIGNSKELPTIPDHLSQEGKEFVSLCLQRNPQHRPTAAQLLEHPFVKNAAPLERVEKPLLVSEAFNPPSRITNGTRTLGVELQRNLSGTELEKLAVRSSKVLPTRPRPREFHIQRNISCPVSPIGSPLLHPRSPQHLSGMMSPSPISSPRATSGSSTPLTGGSGAIPFHQSHQLIYMQESFGTVMRSPNNVFLNGTCYHDPNMNAFRGMQAGPHTLTAFVGSEKDVQLKPVRPGPGDLCNGQSELADCVSQQLLWEQVKLNSSIEFSPRSTLPNRTIGL